MTAALIMGSVGVRHAEMTSDDTKSNLGKRTWTKASEKSVRTVGMFQLTDEARLPAHTNHPNAIVGTTIMRRLLAFVAIYFFGNWTPMAKRPVTSTPRMISRVSVSVMPVQERG